MARRWIVWFDLCEDCAVRPAVPGETLRTSSAQFPYCARCGQYGLTSRGWCFVRLPAVKMSEEPCDCMERFGRIMHASGGHYHYARWRLL
jgi:hypothetical protein